MIGIVRAKFLVRSSLVVSLMLTPLAWSIPQASAKPGIAHLQFGTTTQTQRDGNDSASQPEYRDYKGVQIGTPADEVREKLGEPELMEENQDLFLISDVEMVQVVYDKEGKVTTVSITYSGNVEAAPTARAVLGEDVAAAADGRVYKLVSYPSVGYWVAYSRTAGDDPIVSITMQRM